jgi:hypothetical protein
MRRAMELLEKRKKAENLELSKERDHTPVRNANPMNHSNSVTNNRKKNASTSNISANLSSGGDTKFDTNSLGGSA